uniref:CD47 molecule n=1 Tax=Ovis aries TaxID=9940 RepID=A0AC11AWK3_SHEEP
MWPLVVVLLLASVRCGSAQLIFNVIKSVEYTLCNQTVVIPCFVNNVETKNITELYVRWKFKGENIFIFDGSKRMSKPSSNFSSAKITPPELLRGIASLKMDKSDAVVGNYTCEVTELSREGETIIELKYRVVSWFSPNENILIVIFPVLAILLFWGQFGIVTLKYKSNYTKEKAIFLLVAGLLLTVLVIVGAFLFIPEPDILECEVKWALGSITMNKASGGDGIPVGLFQILKDDAVKVLHSICQHFWKTQQWPQDWKRSVFIPMPKKGTAKECLNYCTIALISHASKVMF